MDSVGIFLLVLSVYFTGTQGEAWIQLEKRKHQEELDAVTAQLVHTEELLAHYKEESIKLNFELSQLKLQMERLPVLEGQVELFRQECNQEKESHRSTQEELKQLKEEYQQLQNQNQELMDEINVYAHSQVLQLQKELLPPENWDIHHSQALTTDPDRAKERETLANLETEFDTSDPIDPTDV
ncbi:interaptin-like, partial [Limulus polyphemus]|uniref:Interaptin-like n=1 Tax=Limulus polyphemus TaxID=6850 RepID=A0ABM1S012_LIMPO